MQLGQHKTIEKLKNKCIVFGANNVVIAEETCKVHKML